MGMHQGSVLSPFIFTVVIDVVIEFASELLYADDLDLWTIEGLRNEFSWRRHCLMYMIDGYVGLCRSFISPFNEIILFKIFLLCRNLRIIPEFFLCQTSFTSSVCIHSVILI